MAELIGGLRDDHAEQVTGGRAVLAAARLPQRIHRLAQRRLDALSGQARHLLMTAALLGPAFRLEDAAEMLSETPATLLPAVQEAMAAAHSAGLARSGPARLGQAAAQHPDPWARASAAEALAVLLAVMVKDQAIRHLRAEQQPGRRPHVH